MTKADILLELEEVETPLRLCKVAVDKGYISAAIAYLDEIESGIVQLRAAINRLPAPKLVAANLLHPNDPAFVPYIYE